MLSVRLAMKILSLVAASSTDGSGASGHSTRSGLEKSPGRRILIAHAMKHSLGQTFVPDDEAIQARILGVVTYCQSNTFEVQVFDTTTTSTTYDTTRLALTYWFYLMGKHPDVQERMREEVLNAYKLEGDHLSTETLTSLSYTNQVISETLRLYPPVTTFTTRRAKDDWRHGRYLIKKGTSVMVPVYHLQRDPLYWVDPDKFDPDRFSPANKHLINPLAYQPFGIGHRVCIGQRLALLELASVTAQVLRHFRILLGPRQKPHLELKTFALLAVPRDDVWIQVKKLNTVK